jgi:hypothetical protein
MMSTPPDVAFARPLSGRQGQGARARPWRGLAWLRSRRADLGCRWIGVDIAEGGSLKIAA